MLDWLKDYIDTKDLVTGLIGAAVAGIFIIVRKHIPALLKRLKRTPPDMLILDSEGTDLGIRIRTYKKWRITNAGMRGIRRPKRIALLDLNGHIVINVSCNVTFRSDIMRFGFKFFPNAINAFPKSKIESNGTWLFHIGKDGRDKEPFALVYEGMSRRVKQTFHAYPDIGVFDDTRTIVRLSLEYTVDGLKFLVNGREVDRIIGIPVDAMANMILVAWADRGEAVSFEVNELQVWWRPKECGPMPEGVVGTL